MKFMKLILNVCILVLLIGCNAGGGGNPNTGNIDSTDTGDSTDSGDNTGGADNPDTTNIPSKTTFFEQKVYLKASNIGAGDKFGGSIAFDGDTLVVGAPGEDGDMNSTAGAPNDIEWAAGAVYVFTRSGEEWIQQAYLKANNAEFADGFGTSVALDGDTIVVGAPGEGDHAPISSGIEMNSSGAAYVFTRSGVVWSQQAYLKASNAQEKDYFGSSVAIDGDTVVVGAVGEDGAANSTVESPNDNAPESGAAYVFTRSGVEWSQQAYLKASNGERDDEFGYSVAIDGDIVMVGAIYEDGDTKSTATATNDLRSDAGAVYGFTRTGGKWSQEVYLKPNEDSHLGRFGSSVALDGSTLVVGAIGAWGGKASVFTLEDGVWGQQAILEGSNITANDWFGYSVAIAGDTVVVGANQEDGDADSTVENANSNARRAGAAYVYTRSGELWTQQAYLKASNAGGGLPGDQFGYSVALDGQTVVVGAFYEAGDSISTAEVPNDNANGAGAVYIFAESQ